MEKSTILLCGPPRDAVGGGPTHMRNLLSSRLAVDYRLVVFETGSRGAESPARDEPVAARIWRLASSPFALALVILRDRPAVVHLNTAVDAKGFWRELSHLMVCKLLGRRIVYQTHGGSLEALIARPGMRTIVRTVYAWPDAFVLLASAERAEFERLGGMHRLVVIPNAVETAVFRGATRVHSGEIRRLAYLGRLNGAKGEKESIQAIALLRDDAAFPGLELRIAGSGPARTELEALASNLGVRDRVNFLGAVHGDDKIRFLREADVLLLPTYHREGLPYVILESLAAGTPVVTTRVGGIPDVVKPPDHGRFVEPRDPRAIVAALRDLAASPDALRAMSRACSEWAERELGLNRLAMRFETLYLELGADPANDVSPS